MPRRWGPCPAAGRCSRPRRLGERQPGPSRASGKPAPGRVETRRFLSGAGTGFAGGRRGAGPASPGSGGSGGSSGSGGLGASSTWCFPPVPSELCPAVLSPPAARGFVVATAVSLLPVGAPPAQLPSRPRTGIGSSSKRWVWLSRPQKQGPFCAFMRDGNPSERKDQQWDGLAAGTPCPAWGRLHPASL